MEKTVLSLDLGATSGRIIAVSICQNKLKLFEIHRFKDYLISNNNLYWNIEYILSQIIIGIKKAQAMFNIESIGISTWGCDFCLIDKEGNLLRNPLCYRDQRNEIAMQELLSKVDYKNIYKLTGIQLLRFNTIFQLYYLRNREKLIYDKTWKILLIADYIVYRLTGFLGIEESNASTTALYDKEKKSFNQHLLDLIDIDISKFPQVVKAGTECGYLKKEFLGNGGKQIKVISVLSHDTASAIYGSISSFQTPYICSGTWSLMGTLLDRQNKSMLAYKNNFTNEIGYDGKIRFLKNIMGMWIFEEFRKETDNNDYSYLINEASKINDLNLYIDPDDELFIEPNNMKKKINKYLSMTNQHNVSLDSEYTILIFQSLTLKYRYLFEKLCLLTNKQYKEINIVGGGSKNDFLSQMVSSCLNIDVYAGPCEATVLGNALIQLEHLNIINIEDHCNLIKSAENIKIYHPVDHKKWNVKYKQFLKIIEGGQNE